MSELVRSGLLLAAAAVAGAINAVAGGGTLVTFPSLLAAGLSPVAANATSTVALVPGSLSSFFGYRAHVRGQRALLWAMVVPSLAGGAIGAELVHLAGDVLFGKLVPWLILGATALLMARSWLVRGADVPDTGPIPARRALVFAGWQLLVGVYGGFFGAGVGILMLAALGLLGMSNIHQMNGLKNLAAVAMNLVAALVFALQRHVHWGLALLMAVGGIAGGYAGAGLAQKVGQAAVRRLVTAIGLGLGLYLLLR